MSVPDVWASNPRMYIKLQEFFAGGKYYEAQQVYMTQVNRSASAGIRESAKAPATTTGAFVDGSLVPTYSLPTSTKRALDLLEDAVKSMFLPPAVTPADVDSAYITSRMLAARELIYLYVSTLEKVHAKVTPSLIDALVALIDSLPSSARVLAETLSTDVDMKVLRDAAYSAIKAALKWTQHTPVAVDEGSEPFSADTEPVFHRHGAAPMHLLAARILGEEPTPEASYHWARAHAPEEHIKGLLSVITHADEIPYARTALTAVLDYLAVEDLRGARVLQRGLGTRPLSETDAKILADFAEVSVAAVAREGAGPVYQKAMNSVKRLLTSQDDKGRLEELAQEVGSAWFGLPPPVSLMDQVMSMAQGMSGLLRR